MVGFGLFVGMILKQKEKALNDPSDLKDADVRTIVTVYDYLPNKFKTDEIEEIYQTILGRFNEEGMLPLEGF